MLPEELPRGSYLYPEIEVLPTSESVSYFTYDCEVHERRPRLGLDKVHPAPVSRLVRARGGAEAQRQGRRRNPEGGATAQHRSVGPVAPLALLPTVVVTAIGEGKKIRTEYWFHEVKSGKFHDLYVVSLLISVVATQTN